MIAGIAVQMISSRVLPWIGGPSSSSSPGRIRKRQTQYRTITITSTKTGTEKISRTSQSVSTFSAWVEACGGNQSISSPRPIPISEAISPIATSSRVCAGLSGRVATCSLSVTSSGPMDAASYRRAGTEGTAVPGGVSARSTRARAEVRRSEAAVAAERLRELGRLAVADALRDLAHGHATAREQLGGAVHPHLRQVLAERRVADLGVGTLELPPRRRDPARDVV